MNRYVYGGYLIYLVWKHFNIIKYSYKAACYLNHWIIDKPEQADNDWVLCSIDDPSVLVQEVEMEKIPK